jgi:hypothetical protein
MHSGWLVGDFFGRNGTAIIPHYWVVNSDGKHFDITPHSPFDAQSYEYVSDLNIAEYASQNAQLPVPLKLEKDGQFVALHNDGKFEQVETIDYQYLFQLATQ